MLIDCLSMSRFYAYCLTSLRLRPRRNRRHSPVPGLCAVGAAGRFDGHRCAIHPLQAQGLSAIVFAGAAQLVAIGMVKSGANLISIVLTTLLLTSQHLLYGMHLRPTLSPLNPLAHEPGLSADRRILRPDQPL
jgi:hypothetical protein